MLRVAQINYPPRGQQVAWSIPPLSSEPRDPAIGTVLASDRLLLDEIASKWTILVPWRLVRRPVAVQRTATAIGRRHAEGPHPVPAPARTERDHLANGDVHIAGGRALRDLAAWPDARAAAARAASMDGRASRRCRSCAQGFCKTGPDVGSGMKLSGPSSASGSRCAGRCLEIPRNPSLQNGASRGVKGDLSSGFSAGRCQPYVKARSIEFGPLKHGLTSRAPPID